MSRKSRQKMGRSILSKLPPMWILIPMLVIGLGMGMLCLTLTWTAQPTPYEDTIPLSATMAEVFGNYTYSRKPALGWELDDIRIRFTDHEQLLIDDVIANDDLLDKLEAYPSGTVFEMRLEPNGIDIMTLAVDGMDVLTYEAACRTIKGNNTLGIPVGIFMLVMAGYAAWGLCMTWKYRRLTPRKEQHG